ncbi:MAG: hypothetical protein M3P06_19240 [Acidobacteriota bacterium]|nr:hypothetical protein [Acidobacteriota bacterium]
MLLIVDLLAIADAKLNDASVLFINGRTAGAQYVAAPWARHDHSTLGYIADALKAHLEPVEMVQLARIVILNAAEDPVRSITENYSVEHGRVALRDPELFNLPVTHGYIITSRRAA